MDRKKSGSKRPGPIHFSNQAKVSDEPKSITMFRQKMDLHITLL
jgi:hypothetical protein